MARQIWIWGVDGKLHRSDDLDESLEELDDIIRKLFDDPRTRLSLNFSGVGKAHFNPNNIIWAQVREV